MVRLQTSQHSPNVNLVAEVFYRDIGQLVSVCHIVQKELKASISKKLSRTQFSPNMGTDQSLYTSLA